jgi:hypothetical protein
LRKKPKTIKITGISKYHSIITLSVNDCNPNCKDTDWVSGLKIVCFFFLFCKIHNFLARIHTVKFKEAKLIKRDKEGNYI